MNGVYDWKEDAAVVADFSAPTPLNAWEQVARMQRMFDQPETLR